MTIYLVLDDFRGERVVSAYSTEEAAFNWIQSNSDGFLRYWIYSIEVDAKR